MDGPLFTPEELARYARMYQAQPPEISAPAPDPAPNRTYQKIGRPFVWGGNAADLGSTAWVKAQDGRRTDDGRGTVRTSEANPLLGENMSMIALAKLGAAAGEDFLLSKLSKNHPTLARNLGILTGVANTAIAARNVMGVKRALRGGSE